MKLLRHCEHCGEQGYYSPMQITEEDYNGGDKVFSVFVRNERHCLHAECIRGWWSGYVAENQVTFTPAYMAQPGGHTKRRAPP